VQASVLNYPSMTSKSDFFFCGTGGLGGLAAPPVVSAPYTPKSAAVHRYIQECS
jgi:hypothetical protein